MNDLHYKHNRGSESTQKYPHCIVQLGNNILYHRFVAYEWRVAGETFDANQPGAPFPNNTSRFHLRKLSSSFGLRAEAVLSPTLFAMSLPVWVTEASFFLALFRCSTPQKAASALPYLTLCISTPRWFKASQNWWKFCKGEAELGGGFFGSTCD